MLPSKQSTDCFNSTENNLSNSKHFRYEKPGVKERELAVVGNMACMWTQLARFSLNDRNTAKINWLHITAVEPVYPIPPH